MMFSSYPYLNYELQLSSIEGLEDQLNKRKSYYKKLSAVPHYPRMIDSRGRILRPAPSSIDKNTFTGASISPGHIEGRVRILKSQYDKPLEPGEILVTEAADPG